MLKAYVDTVDQGGQIMPRLCVIGDCNDLIAALESIKFALGQLSIVAQTMPVLPSDVQNAMGAVAAVGAAIGGVTTPTTMTWSTMEAVAHPSDVADANESHPEAHP